MNAATWSLGRSFFIKGGPPRQPTPWPHGFERDYDQLSVTVSCVRLKPLKRLKHRIRNAKWAFNKTFTCRHVQLWGCQEHRSPTSPPIPKQESQNPTQPTNLLIQAQQKRSPLSVNPSCFFVLQSLLLAGELGNPQFFLVRPQFFSSFWADRIQILRC